MADDLNHPQPQRPRGAADKATIWQRPRAEQQLDLTRGSHRYSKRHCRAHERLDVRHARCPTSTGSNLTEARSSGVKRSTTDRSRGAYSTRDTETTRLGSWDDQRYRERSNEQAKYRSISPLSIQRRNITHHIDALADPDTDRTSNRLSPAILRGQWGRVKARGRFFVSSFG